MDYLIEIDGPRKPGNGTLHPKGTRAQGPVACGAPDFQEILVIATAAMLADCDPVEDIAYWAPMKDAWLPCFLVPKNGIPPGDAFLRIFRVLTRSNSKRLFGAGSLASLAH